MFAVGIYGERVCQAKGEQALWRSLRSLGLQLAGVLPDAMT